MELKVEILQKKILDKTNNSDGIKRSPISCKSKNIMMLADFMSNREFVCLSIVLRATVRQGAVVIYYLFMLKAALLIWLSKSDVTWGEQCVNNAMYIIIMMHPYKSNVLIFFISTAAIISISINSSLNIDQHGA